jgi:eukaryotic-like serine/threonine-protein kinase
VVAGLEILHLHAQGGMAEVYRARGKGADGVDYEYAVKRILPEFTLDPNIRNMFVEESRVAAMLVHPNVVRVYDLAMDGVGDQADYFMVMEFLDGKDLSEGQTLTQRGKARMPVWFTLQVARDVLRALHYVSAEAVDVSGALLELVHRDISPHNIFVCHDGQVKLTDFGVAKVRQSRVETQVGVTKGKLGYMSPEQLTGSKLDVRSDLYNVGILLYECLTGDTLFKGETTTEYLQSMIRGHVPAMSADSQVPADLEAVVRRALERDRNKRPPSAAAMEQELGAIAARYQLQATPAQIGMYWRQLFSVTTPTAAPVPAKVAAEAPKKLQTMMIADKPRLAPAPLPRKPIPRMADKAPIDDMPRTIAPQDDLNEPTVVQPGALPSADVFAPRKPAAMGKPMPARSNRTNDSEDSTRVEANPLSKPQPLVGANSKRVVPITVDRKR